MGDRARIVPTVEQTGADEGYLDVGEVARDFLEARVVAEAVQTAVRAATSLTCSLGVAPCKVVAKVGSDARKPGGLTVVVPGHEASFLAPFDVRRLPGVGPKAEARLRACRRSTRSGRLRGSATRSCAGVPGSVGELLRDRARGVDPRGLELDTERIWISVENAFDRDLVDRERLHDELRGMAREVSEHLQKSGQVARTVTTKLRYRTSRSAAARPPSTSASTRRSRSEPLACGLPTAASATGRGRCGLSEWVFQASPASASFRFLRSS